MMNAVADAIPGGAGAQLDMPATAEKLWQACRKAQPGRERRLVACRYPSIFRFWYIFAQSHPN